MMERFMPLFHDYVTLTAVCKLYASFGGNLPKETITEKKKTKKKRDHCEDAREF